MPSKSFLFARIVSIIPTLWSHPNFVKGLTVYQKKENKIDWSKSKAHADENINVPKQMIFFFGGGGGGGGQKTMWKRENMLVFTVTVFERPPFQGHQTIALQVVPQQNT